MLSNLKIGLRLILAFVLVAGASAVVGLVGIHTASRINEMSDRMYDTELLGLSFIKEANIDLIYVGRARSNYMLATTNEERAKQLDAVQKSLVMMKDNVAKAKPLFVTEKGQQLIKSVNASAEEYEKELQTLLDLAGQRKLQERDVKMGISNLTRIEITSGINPGMTIAVGTTTNQPLTDGLSVKIVQR